MEDRIQEYLTGLPSKLVKTEHIEILFRKLRGFTPSDGQPGFKPTELLNIANLRPTSLVFTLATEESQRSSGLKH